MTRSRVTALTLAVVCCTIAILAAVWLHAGFLSGADWLLEVVEASWSDEQIKIFTQYVFPLALLLLLLGEALFLWSKLRAKKQ